MTATADQTTIPPVLRSVTVKGTVDKAFRVFTEGFDTWWPRTHHIGKAPLQRSLVECGVGGRCYSEHTDGSECQWGQILVWDPPRRIVIAWQISAQWQFEPDLAKSSEVEIRFTPEPDGGTRVDLEHRCFERMGAGGVAMSAGVGGEGGWNGILQAFRARAEAEQ